MVENAAGVVGVRSIRIAPRPPWTIVVSTTIAPSGLAFHRRGWSPGVEPSKPSAASSSDRVVDATVRWTGGTTAGGATAGGTTAGGGGDATGGTRELQL